MSLKQPVYSRKRVESEPETVPIGRVREVRRSGRRRGRWGWRLVGLVVLTALSVGLFTVGPHHLPDDLYVRMVADSNAPADPGLGVPAMTLLPAADVTHRPAMPGGKLSADHVVPPRPQEQLRPWAQRLSDRLDIPLTALEAYGFAAAQLDAERPQCHLSWTMLAGIGKQESNHGRHGGARLDSNGRTNVPIRGIPLDGSPGVQRLPATDHGQLSGDPQWERAMGPFQFIPETWKRKGRDADADGIADPDDISDAALTAGSYLCDTNADLGTAPGWWHAIGIYNQSHEYGQSVLDDATRYGLLSRDR